MERHLMAALLATSLAACGAEPPAEQVPTPAPPDPAGRFAEAIERAHGGAGWRAHEALAAGIRVEFGGKTVLDGRIVFTTDMGRSRIELKDGSVAVWDGATAWLAPAGSSFEGARFHVLTWPYFALAPIKLRDPGTRLELLGSRELQGRTLEAGRLTFEKGVGDTPDDWYVVYRDPESGRLHGMAYIVTFGTPTEKAEAEPHAITYHDYADVDGVPVPTRWSFWLWSEQEGIHGEAIGSVTLADPSFVEPEPGLFDPPEGAKEQPLPAPAA